MQTDLTQAPSKHIVDELLEERAPRLLARPRLFAAIRSILNPVLQYDEAKRIADIIGPLSGDNIMHYAEDRLKFQLQIDGIEHLPASGPTMIASNHPTGLADGVATWQTTRRVRNDIMFYGNRDSHRIAPRLLDFIIPVELNNPRMMRESSRLTLKMTQETMEQGRVLLIFPAGRMCYRDRFWRLRERPWKTTFLKSARRYGAPIIPMHIHARNSHLFYAFQTSNLIELRDICLFYEIINKKRYPFHISIGEPVDVSGYENKELDGLCELLRRYVERGNFNKPFQVTEPLEQVKVLSSSGGMSHSVQEPE